MLRQLRRSLAWICVSALILASLSAAPWPAVESNLSPDPALRLGTLPNGVRYAVLPNAEPRGRVSLRLVVAAGSLVESDDERGLAHFIEHMAFRGTREHPAGTLTAELERLGLGMGPDHTAFTTYDHTIYHLELPDTTEPTLRAGLRTFREYAESITFDPALIERERGVVLSEMAARNTPEQRLALAHQSFLWKNSRRELRSPIGVAPQLRTFTREQFVAFYDAWYRPERLAVVVVGDVTPARIEPLIAEIFSPLTARAPARPEPPDLDTAEPTPPTIEGQLDPGMLGLSIAFEHPSPAPAGPDTATQRAQELQRALAFHLFQRRLNNLAVKLGSSFVAPTTSFYENLPGWNVAQVSVNGKPDNWRIVCRDVEQEHRRVFLHGFTEQELRIAKAAFTASFEESVRSASTRRSEALIAGVVGCLLRGRVFSTPAATWRELQPVLDATTAAECAVAFRTAWSTKAPHVFIAGNSAFAVTRTAVAELLNESRRVEVLPPVETPEPVFAYTDFGPPGTLVREERVEDLDVRLTEFANGVRLNFKPTDFESDLVQVHVRVGSGKGTQPATQPGLDFLANAAFTSAGLKRHTNEELSNLFAGHPMQFGFGVDWDSGGFTARCARRDLTLALQIVAAFLTDPAWRPEAMSHARASFGSMYQKFANAPGGPSLMTAERLLAGGDLRWGTPTPNELGARNFTELAAWLEPQLKHGAIEMSIVGDVPWSEALAATARTLGALPKRDPRPAPETIPVFKPAPAPSTMIFTAGNPQLKQVSLALLLPVPDLADVHHERRLRLLAAVVSDRLRRKLREELGATYSPETTFIEHEAQPGLSYLWCYADVDPARFPQAALIMKRELQALHDHGTDDDEFTRAKNPFVSDRVTDLRTNAYWGYTVLRDAQQRPARLAAARDRATDTAAITRDEIEALAKRYLDVPHAYFFVAAPGQATRSVVK